MTYYLKTMPYARLTDRQRGILGASSTGCLKISCLTKDIMTLLTINMTWYLPRSILAMPMVSINLSSGTVVAGLHLHYRYDFLLVYLLKLGELY
jgi:hypothetical protein